MDIYSPDRTCCCQSPFPSLQLLAALTASLVSYGVVTLRISHNEFHCRTSFSHPFCLELLGVKNQLSAAITSDSFFLCSGRARPNSGSVFRQTKSRYKDVKIRAARIAVCSTRQFAKESSEYNQISAKRYQCSDGWLFLLLKSKAFLFTC